jgi:hypothetical protein
VGSDDKILHAWVSRKRHLDRHGRAARPAPLVEHVGHGLCGKGAAPVSVREGGIELTSTVLVEEPEQATGGPAKMPAVKGNVGQERLSGSTRREQPIAAAVVARFSFVRAEGREVPLVFNLLAHAPGAGVTCNLDFTVEHTHDGLGGDEG